MSRATNLSTDCIDYIQDRKFVICATAPAAFFPEICLQQLDVHMQ